MRKRPIIGILGAIIGTLIVLVGAYLALDVIANSVARERADAVVGRLNTADRQVAFDGVRVNTLSRELVIEGLSVRAAEGPPVSVRRLILRRFDWANPGAPRHLSLRAEDAALPLGENGVLAQTVLAATGLGRLSADIAYRYDSETGTFAVEQLRLAPAGAGSLVVRLTFGDVDNLAFGDAAAMQAALLRASFVSGEAVYRDGGLTGRLVEAYAAANGQSPDEARETLAGQVAGARAELAEPLIQTLMRAYERFLSEPGASELIVRARPERPVPYAELLALDPGDEAARTRLGLEITAR